MILVPREVRAKILYLRLSCPDRDFGGGHEPVRLLEDAILYPPDEFGANGRVERDRLLLE
jgi:hypothetical protein